MRHLEPGRDRAYVPHPGPTVGAGVLVFATGFWANASITGGVIGYTAHGWGLLALGCITLFAGAESVDVQTQWWYSLILGIAVIASGEVIGVQMGTGIQATVEYLRYGLSGAVVVILGLAIINSTRRRTANDDATDIDIERKDTS